MKRNHRYETLLRSVDTDRLCFISTIFGVRRVQGWSPQLRACRRRYLNTPRCVATLPAGESEAEKIERVPLRKGDDVHIRITRIAYGGAGVGEILHPTNLLLSDMSMPIYTPKGACPGDIVRCIVTKVRRRQQNKQPEPNSVSSNGSSSRTYAEALFRELLQASSHAVQPPCIHFGSHHLGGGGCGGCTSMQMPYSMQIEEKQQQLEALFADLSEEHAVKPFAFVPCEQTLEYRNKMEFSYGRRWYVNTSRDLPRRESGEYEYVVGLHAPQRFDKVIPIETCHIQPSISNKILNYVRVEAEKMLLEPYDTRQNTGYLRNVAIRSATNKNGAMEVMVNIITSPCDVPERLKPLAQSVKRTFPEVVCVVQNIRGAKSSFSVEEEQERLLAGERRYIEQHLCDLTFRISANSFFQTNSRQAEVLYECVRRAAKLCRDDVVLDLFCGTGTIALCLARDVKEVYGIDLVSTAIADARVNATVNGITNAKFEEGNLDKLKAARTKPPFIKPNVIVVDPPRAGLHPDLVKYLASVEMKRVVYVSCNPVTQKRDIQKLLELAPGRFQVHSIQPVDMFPNTHHMECIITLEAIH
ncbi:RNA methyltransferase [Gracilaria domingensis]|nr:RNA methyltransferase [Gracilaria domingensis]